MAAFSDWQTWSSQQRGNLLNDMPQRIGKTLGTTDPPRHTQARKLVNKAFTPRTVAVLEPTIRAHARALAAAAREQGTFEYVHDIAAPLNANVLGAMFGMSEDDVLRMRPWLDDFFTRDAAPDGGEPPHVAAMAKLRGALDDLTRLRSEQPGDDLVSAMIAAEDEGARLSHEQVVVTTMTFLTAGFESTNNLLTNIAHALAQIDGLFDTVKSDPSLVAALAEEGSRWDSAAQGFVRMPHPRRGAARDDDPGGRAGPHPHRLGQPGRAPVPGPRRLPARPGHHPPARARPRHPLLCRRATRPSSWPASPGRSC